MQKSVYGPLTSVGGPFFVWHGGLGSLARAWMVPIQDVRRGYVREATEAACGRIARGCLYNEAQVTMADYERRPRAHR